MPRAPALRMGCGNGTASRETLSPQTGAHMLLCHAWSQGARTRHGVVSTLHA
jgi:hypothetical protein